MKKITKIVNIRVFITFQFLILISFNSEAFNNTSSISSHTNFNSHLSVKSTIKLATQSYTSNFIYMSMGNKAPVQVCASDESGNQFNNCHNVSWTLDYPTSVTIHPLHKYIYTVNSQSGFVSACPLNVTTGDFSICNMSWYDFKNPSSLAFSPDGKQAYITDYMENGSVWLCLVNEDNMLPTNCKATGFGFKTPSSIIIDPTGNYAYISDYNNNSVVKCNVTKPSGLLENCVVYYASLLKPIGLTFNNKINLYIANRTNVEYAITDGNGNLNFLNSYYGFSNLAGLTSYMNNLYIADGGNGVVSICKLDSKTNFIASCYTGASNKMGISGIAILAN